MSQSQGSQPYLSSTPSIACLCLRGSSSDRPTPSSHASDTHASDGDDEVDKFMSLWSGGKPFKDDYERRILTTLDIRQLSQDGRMGNPDEKPLVLPAAQTVLQTEIVERTNAKPLKEDSAPPAQKIHKEKNSKQPKEASSKVIESSTKKYIFDIEEEIHSLEKQPNDMNPKSKEVDEPKLTEMKREDEIAKNKKAMERNKKLAEKAAAKAAIKAQKEAEMKLKENILLILSFFSHFLK
ncbi:proton pump-interactor 1-like [Nicotiana tomentosiformis]|uniref:proton pump-interactor 1-like n=1 Tax=Nicotiana tomentosiformis TaxID=4098 RepID=UPI00051C85B0